VVAVGDQRGRTRALGPRLSVALLSAVLAALAAAVWATAVPRHVPVDDGVPLPWWLVAVLAFASEIVVLHVQVRRNAHALSLNEIALVCGLFFAAPTELVAGWMLATVAIGLWHRQSASKLAFNTSLCVLGAVLALSTFHFLRAGDPGLGVQAWAAALAATAVVAGVDCLAVGAAIGLIEELVQDFRRGLVTSAATTVAALVAVHAVAATPIAALPVAACIVALLAGYRRFASLEERHLTLERVHQVSRVLSSTPEVDELLRRVLQQTREALMAERAEVIFVAAEPGQLPLRVDLGRGGALRQARLTAAMAADPLFQRLVAGAGPLLVPRGSRDPAHRAFLDSAGLRDAVAAPLHGEAGIVGVVLGADRVGHLRSFDDDDVRLLLTVADQTGVALQRGELVDRLRHDAQHDALTGLANRAQLNQRLVDALAVTPARTGGLALVVLDLRDLRSVNDVLGHAVGDRILQEMGKRLSGVAGEHDVVARLGGDEFAVVVEGVPDATVAIAAARRILSALEGPIAVDGIEVEVGVSLGLALAPQHGLEAQQLLKRAEGALLTGRRDGNPLQVYDESEERPVSPRRLALLSELRHGIQSGELVMYLQPQADLRTGQVVGAEALVRWAHPAHGLLAPDEFIPLAERSGLIRPLTSWMMAQAISAAGRWHRTGQQLSIAVNLSARSVLDPDLIPGVEALLQIHHLPAELLTLEITESSVLGDPHRTREVLLRLHGLGVRLSIDDFGTGYSSLSYLRQLPVQEVKVDRSFVEAMLAHPEDESIVRSIVDLGSSLGLGVVAEGVEDRPTWDRLATIGCQLVQGYYLSRPLPLAEFDAWLQTRTGTAAPSTS
jgi:diguanylate cyclase (GGDEF)-like protein